MATIKDLLSSMISKINSKVSTWEELPDKPFGVTTEMVEIVPEQSVTSKTADYVEEAGAHLAILDIVPVVNSDYDIKFNNKMYHLKCREDIANNGTEQKTFITIGAPFGETGIDFTEIPFVVQYDISKERTMLCWLASLDATVTISIFGEGEVVTPLDSKFTAPVVWYSLEDCLYHDKNYTLPVSEDEVKEYSTNDIAIITPNGYVFRPTCIKVKPSGCEIVSYDGDYSVRFYCYGTVS